MLDEHARAGHKLYVPTVVVDEVVYKYAEHLVSCLKEATHSLPKLERMVRRFIQPIDKQAL